MNLFPFIIFSTGEYLQIFGNIIFYENIFAFISSSKYSPIFSIIRIYSRRINENMSKWILLWAKVIFIPNFSRNVISLALELAICRRLLKNFHQWLTSRRDKIPNNTFKVKVLPTPHSHPSKNMTFVFRSSEEHISDDNFLKWQVTSNMFLTE